MHNIPDVHTHDREIPAGKVLIAEYRDIGPNDRRSQMTVLDSKPAWEGRTTVQLVARTAGWAIAGSCMRWDNGHFGVRWERDGTEYGRRYRTFDEALDHFNRIPD